MQAKPAVETWADGHTVRVTLERDQLAAENKSLHIKLALLANAREGSATAEVRRCLLVRIILVVRTYTSRSEKHTLHGS